MPTMALTEYPVSKFASGKSTYRAVATTIGASVARGRAISKLINDLVWFRSFRAKVVTRNELSQRSARESVRVSPGNFSVTRSRQELTVTRFERLRIENSLDNSLSLWRQTPRKEGRRC